MYIRDGIVYAGEVDKPIRVRAVVPIDDYCLHLTFTNGEQRIFDCKPLFQYEVFSALKDCELFNKAHVDYGTVVWNEDIDYAPETLYSASVPTTEGVA